jgi:hypothetical protein
MDEIVSNSTHSEKRINCGGLPDTSCPTDSNGQHSLGLEVSQRLDICGLDQSAPEVVALLRMVQHASHLLAKSGVRMSDGS